MILLHIWYSNEAKQTHEHIMQQKAKIIVEQFSQVTLSKFGGNCGKALQMLSRLNRICKGKVETYLLVFVNSREVIKNHSKLFYEDAKLVGALDVSTDYDYYDKVVNFSI